MDWFTTCINSYQQTLLENFSANQISQAERIYVLLVSIFIGMLLITHVITAKYITIANLTLTAGAITYPFTFSLLGIITEIYGTKLAKIAVWMGLIASLFMIAVIQLARMIPVYSQSIVTQHAFQVTFNFTPGIFLGSMIAYLVAQFIDIYLLAFMRKLMHGHYLWLRNASATWVSQLIDTLVFGSIAWIIWPLILPNKAVEPLPWDTWYQLTINEYGLKMAFTLCNAPFVYLGVYLTKHWLKP